MGFIKVVAFILGCVIVGQGIREKYITKKEEEWPLGKIIFGSFSILMGILL